MRVNAIRFDSASPGSWACAVDSRTTLWCDHAGRVWIDDHPTELSPLDALGAIPSMLHAGDRAAGFVAYEFAAFCESIVLRPRGQATPLFAFALGRARQASPVGAESKRSLDATARSGVDRASYLRAVGRVIDYIGSGDTYQINLTRPIACTTSLSPAQVYARLLDRSTPRFGALIEADDFSVVSGSPELFFRIEQRGSQRVIINQPIKGTRPRGPGMLEELEHSAKDRAELAMIVDLQRNDLGRVCEVGSVAVTEPRVIETHPTVYHGVATVEGALRPDIRIGDVFRAVFPCGSITGCPKIRAMQIIDELEVAPRGPYCGAIGWIDSSGLCEFSVAIRTAVMRDGLATLGVGGGIVADSMPADEWDETEVKARAMLDALGVPVPQRP
jgi:anthranilate/para-aminobenzoate synthase component I